MPAPVREVGTRRKEDVAERRVAAIARAAQHRVAAADPAREEHTVPVEGKKGVVELVEGLEVVRVAEPDGRPVVAVAPRDEVAILEPGDARVVRVEELLLDLSGPGVGGHERDRLVVDLPVDAVRAPSRVEVHDPLSVVHAEDARESVAERHDGRVEDAVRAGDLVANDDRVAARAPQDVARARRTVFPGNGEKRALDVGARLEARHRGSSSSRTA